MADKIRVRMAGVVAKDYANSSYEDVDEDSYYVWADNDWWIIPWYDILQEEAAEAARLLVVGAGGSDGGKDGGASR